MFNGKCINVEHPHSSPSPHVGSLCSAKHDVFAALIHSVDPMFWGTSDSKNTTAWWGAVVKHWQQTLDWTWLVQSALRQMLTAMRIC